MAVPVVGPQRLLARQVVMGGQAVAPQQVLARRAAPRRAVMEDRLAPRQAAPVVMVGQGMAVPAMAARVTATMAPQDIAQGALQVATTAIPAPMVMPATEAQQLARRAAPRRAVMEDRLAPRQAAPAVMAVQGMAVQAMAARVTATMAPQDIAQGAQPAATMVIPVPTVMPVTAVRLLQAALPPAQALRQARLRPVVTEAQATAVTAMVARVTATMAPQDIAQGAQPAATMVIPVPTVMPVTAVRLLQAALPPAQALRQARLRPVVTEAQAKAVPAMAATVTATMAPQDIAQGAQPAATMVIPVPT